MSVLITRCPDFMVSNNSVLYWSVTHEKQLFMPWNIKFSLWKTVVNSLIELSRISSIPVSIPLLSPITASITDVLGMASVMVLIVTPLRQVATPGGGVSEIVSDRSIVCRWGWDLAFFGCIRRYANNAPMLDMKLESTSQSYLRIMKNLCIKEWNIWKMHCVPNKESNTQRACLCS